ncbi:LOW QUALITY PROTEIN: glutamate receptor-like [Panulirus ornatus]|uniref:LOW QUALITY PROTEIN: glutamate receptor-like n=1 Tax=Panulirus ornatus TaxID=150431 RepID=UPI003A84C7A7
MWWPIVGAAGVVLLSRMAAGAAAPKAARPPSVVLEGVVDLVARQYLAGCSLVLATTQPHSAVFTHILRQVWRGGQASLVLNWEGAPLPPSVLHHLTHGDSTLTCRAIILHLSTNVSTTTVNREAARNIMWLLEEVHLVPETRVVMIGHQVLARHALQHPRLRDTLYAIYLATLDSGTLGQLGSGVGMYRRCLYCNMGNPDVVLLKRWLHLPPTVIANITIFPEKFEDMQGHVLRIVAKDLFPYVSYERETDAPGTMVTPRDSLDVRMLGTVARSLNFTYVVRAPADGQWGGRVRNGSGWTGMVGELGRGEADFSLRLFWSAARKQAIDFTRAYIFEPFVIFTRKPGPSPQHLAPVRPFSGEVWVALVLVTTGAGSLLWAVQRAWSRFSGERGVDLSSALLNTWGMLLQDPLTTLPDNITAQVVVGMWWVFCVVVVAMYRCSLIAHLTAPVSPPPIDTLDQLWAIDGATWGLEGYGVGWNWFKYNTNPKVQQMFSTMRVTGREEQVTRVLSGPHALFTWKHHMKTYLALHHTDARGYTPVHISRQELISGQSGWGVRRGAPFLKPLDRLIGRLAETGLIVHWLNDITDASLSKTRLELGTQAAGDRPSPQGEDEDEDLVLSLGHLQGAFYLLLLGCCIAILTILVERCVAAAKTPTPFAGRP